MSRWIPIGPETGYRLTGAAVEAAHASAPLDGLIIASPSYAYADVSHLTDDSWGLCRQWLTDIDVAVTPGIDFDPVRGNRFVRFSYAGTLDDVREAASRIAAWTSTQRSTPRDERRA